MCKLGVTPALEDMMSDLMNLVQEADRLMLDWENCKSEMDAAKLQVEMAKEKLDAAKQRFDTVINQADDYGVPRAKLRKLVEERSLSLVTSGLFSTPANGPAKPSPATKAPKAKKSPKPMSEAHIAEGEVQDLDQDFMESEKDQENESNA